MAYVPRKGATEERRERMAKALNMRKLGHTYDEIGKQTGVSRQRAYQDVQEALQEITAEPAEEVRKLELERLDALLLKLNQEFKKVDQDRADGINVGKDASSTIAKLVTSALQVMERRARLLGLEAIKAEINGDLLAAVRDAFATLEDTPDDELLDPEDDDEGHDLEED